jgi:hypothetical protein
VRIIALAIISAPLCGVYILSILLHRLSQCPPTAFAIDALTFSIPLVCGATVFFGSVFVLLACLGGVFDENGTKTAWALDSFRTLAFAGSLLGMAVAAMLWLTARETFTCLMPEGLLLHPSPFVQAQTATWDSVDSVRSDCWLGKRGQGGGLRLMLSNGETIELPVWNTARQSVDPAYAAIRTALAGKHTSYAPLSSVDSNRCPPALLRLFSDWHD